MRIFVKFWGVRGSIPTPGPSTRRYGGNTSCYEIRIGDILIICDAGTGIRPLGLDLLKRSPNAIEGHMFLSHAHWDHIQGFPFFLPAYEESTKLFVYGLSTGDDRPHDLLSGQMQTDYFPVSFRDLGGQVIPSYLENFEGQIGDITVRALEQIHPGASHAYSFEHDGRRVVYMTDNEIDQALPEIKDDDQLRPIPQQMVDFVQGADLLIADGQYTEDEYLKKVGWGHARATTVTDLAIAGNVKRLAITHHDPMQSDQEVDAKIAVCRERVKTLSGNVEVFGAREGLEIRIG